MSVNLSGSILQFRIILHSTPIATTLAQATVIFCLRCHPSTPTPFAPRDYSLPFNQLWLNNKNWVMTLLRISKCLPSSPTVKTNILSKAWMVLYNQTSLLTSCSVVAHLFFPWNSLPPYYSLNVPGILLPKVLCTCCTVSLAWNSLLHTTFLHFLHLCSNVT